ncbi:HsmA family protein [Vagococcus humatus]|uniref:TIGR03987 family protein n=1 Tax=Vagococcus humatus TaxID=1889241 RepID=A0A3S0ABG0_9ENTE|nr:HsmA family protein [Vagococcus humatus]RST88966.1 TIGR03987 family protein [Vagococcus humatus]
MSTTLILATISMVIALILYSLGVFGEKLSGSIQKKHLYFFGGGLIFDTIGTTLMTRIAQASGSQSLGMHQITGGLAIFLMVFHLIWAIWVYNKGSQAAKKKFHQFSLGVWTLWVISFLLGMLVGMGII